MGITLVALVLFAALVACWVVLPGSSVVTQAAPEADPAVPTTLRPVAQD